MAAPLFSLPPETLSDIANRLLFYDQLRVSKVCKQLYEVVIPILYSRIVIRFDNRYKDFCESVGYGKGFLPKAQYIKIVDIYLTTAYEPSAWNRETALKTSSSEELLELGAPIFKKLERLTHFTFVMWGERQELTLALWSSVGVLVPALETLDIQAEIACSQHLRGFDPGTHQNLRFLSLRPTSNGYIEYQAGDELSYRDLSLPSLESFAGPTFLLPSVILHSPKLSQFTVLWSYSNPTLECYSAPLVGLCSHPNVKDGKIAMRFGIYGAVPLFIRALSQECSNLCEFTLLVGSQTAATMFRADCLNSFAHYRSLKKVLLFCSRLYMTDEMLLAGLEDLGTRCPTLEEFCCREGRMTKSWRRKAEGSTLKWYWTWA